MLKITKILYPTDFSDFSNAALPAALRLAEKHGAELHLLHAQVLHADDEAVIERSYEELAREARADLEVMAEGGEVGAVRLVPVVRRGISAAPAILEYAAEEDVDLIAMGTHGRRGLRRVLLGSVAEEVVRAAGCPVLAVRREEGEAELTDFGRIVVPVDFSGHSKLGVRHAVELAEAFGADLRLVHVLEQVTYPDFYFPVSVPEWNVGTLRGEARKRLVELASEFARGTDLEVEVEVRVGRAAAEIVDVAEGVGADLIVIASHGLHGLERVLLGSVAERVIRQAPCSVLTVKAFGKRLTAGDGEEAAEPAGKAGTGASETAR